MRRNDFRVKSLHLEIPLYEWVDGEHELLDELYFNYINNPANIERVKRFIITDYLTQLDSDELTKMFIDFKSKKTIEIEERKKQKEMEEAMKFDFPDDDMPF